MYKTTGILSFLLPLLLTIFIQIEMQETNNMLSVLDSYTLDNPDEIAKEIANDLS